MWNRMVLSVAWVCTPVDVVLCNNLVLWKLLPEGSKGANRTCCQCNSCSDIYSSGAYYNNHYRLMMLAEVTSFTENLTCDIFLAVEGNINGVVNSKGESLNPFGCTAY